MTIIAYCPKLNEVYSDSKYTFSNGRAPFLKSKIVISGDGITTVGAGSEPDVQVATQIVFNMIRTLDFTPVACPFVTGNVDIYAKANVQFYVFENVKNFIRMIPAPTYEVVEGSGSAFFVAYRSEHPNKSVLELVRMVAKFNQTCGGDVQSF